MSKAAEQLRALRIFNPHNASTYARERGGLGVYVRYRPYQGGRAAQCAAWQVMRPGYQTDPDAYWRDNRNKTFNVFSQSEKASQFAAAQAWAAERYGITEWAKIPGLPGAWFPAGDAAIVRQAVKDAAR